MTTSLMHSSQSPSNVTGPLNVRPTSPKKDTGRYRNGVAFSDQCVIIPVGYHRSLPPCAEPSRQASPLLASLAPLTPSETTLTGLPNLLHWSEAEPSTSNPLSIRTTYSATIDPAIRQDVLQNVSQLRGKRAWTSSDLTFLSSAPSTSHRTPGLQPQLRRKSILKQPRSSRSESLTQGQGSSTASRGATSTQSAATLTPSKAAHPPFKAAIQAPTPQGKVAAPKAAYRPLVLGSSSDDEHDSWVADGVSSAAAPPLSVTIPAKSVDGRHRNGDGPPVIHSNLAGEKERLYRTQSPIDPVAAISGLYLCQSGSHSSPALLCFPSLPRQVSTKSPFSSAPSIDTQTESSATNMNLTPAVSHHKQLTLTRSISERSHLVKSSSAPVSWCSDWLRRGRRNSGSSSQAEDCAADLKVDVEDASCKSEPTEPELVPLHADCVCQHCSGRISAGLSATYVPHWSKGARAKWLADRRQVAQSINAASSLKTRPLSLTNGEQGLVIPASRVPSRVIRSPPPPVSQQASDAHVVSRPIGSHQSIKGTVTYHPISLGSASAVDRVQHYQSPTILDEGDDDPTADLQQILGGNGAAISPVTESVQVDEVDKKHGRASRPCSLGGLEASSDAERIDQDQHFHAFVPGINRVPTPAGLSEDEVIDVDASLSHQVELEILARETRQRNEKVRKRGGARAMMAMLEEADTDEAIAREQRMHRRASLTSTLSDGSGFATETMNSIPARISTPAPTLSPPISRSNSPLISRLKDTFRSSSRNSNKSSPVEDTRSSPVIAQGQFSTSSDRLRGGHASSPPDKMVSGAIETVPAASQSSSNGATERIAPPPSVSVVSPGLANSSKSSANGNAVPQTASVGLEKSKLSKDSSKTQSPNTRRSAGTDGPAKDTAPSPSGVTQPFSSSKERDYFGAPWNPSLSSSTSSLTGGTATPPDSRRSLALAPSSQVAKPQPLKSGANKIDTVSGTPTITTTTSLTPQVRPGATVKRSATVRESMLAAAPPSVVPPSRRSTSHPQVSSQPSHNNRKNSKPPLVGHPTSSSSSSSVDPTGRDDTEERLKKRSLRRRLSAPLYAAKGLFEHRS